MTDRQSILVDTSRIIAEALTDHDFDYGEFEATYDFENRLPDSALQQERLDVRVIVPRTVHNAERFTGAAMRYTAAYDIDVRFKFGKESQAGESPGIAREVLDNLSLLVEDVHQFFHDNPHPGGSSEYPTWISKDDEVRAESKILIAYSTKFLRDQRMFYAVCREFFWSVR